MMSGRLGSVAVIEVDSDPTTGAGAVAPVGSIAVLPGSSVTWKKSGAGNTAWTPFLASPFSFFDEDSSEGVSTTTTVVTDKLVLTTPALELGDYKLDFYCEISSTALGNATARVLAGIATIASLTTDTVLGTGLPLGGFLFQSAISGIQTYTINFNSSGALVTASIQRARLFLQRVG